MGYSKGPIRLKGLFVFGAVTLGLGYVVPVVGSAAGPAAAIAAPPLASARPEGSAPRWSPTSVLVGYTRETVIQRSSIEFPMRRVEDIGLPAGVTSVEQAGVAGSRIQTVERTFEDGYPVAERVVDEQVRAPVEQVTRVGVRPADPPPSAPPASAPAVESPADPSLAGAQVIAGSATSYCLTGRTATGTIAGPGSIAVDPAVIRLGSHLFVAGYGYGYAVDTGSAIRGTLIDLWLDCEAAIRWGRRPVTIYVLAR